MKKYINVTLIATALALNPLAALAETRTPDAHHVTEAERTSLTATISGLVCAFCAQSLEKVFSARPEVADIKVDMDASTLTLTFQPSRTIPEDEMKKLVLDAGYVVTHTVMEKVSVKP